jgi:hypothetical protein
MSNNIRIERVPEGIRITPVQSDQEFSNWLRDWRDRQVARSGQVSYAVGYLTGVLKSLKQ